VSEERNYAGLTYRQYMREVDEILLEKCGVTHADLSDYCTRDAWEAGQSAHDLAYDILDNDDPDMAEYAFGGADGDLYDLFDFVD